MSTKTEHQQPRKGFIAKLLYWILQVFVFDNVVTEWTLYILSWVRDVAHWSDADKTLFLPGATADRSGEAGPTEPSVKDEHASRLHPQSLYPRPHRARPSTFPLLYITISSSRPIRGVYRDVWPSLCFVFALPLASPLWVTASSRPLHRASVVKRPQDHIQSEIMRLKMKPGCCCPFIAFLHASLTVQMWGRHDCETVL